MSYRSIVMTLTARQPTSLAEWKVQCGRVISLLFALIGLILSLSVISTCDFFHTTVITNVETSTGTTGNASGDRSIRISTFDVSVGLFGYATIAHSSTGKDDTTGSTMSCRRFDPNSGIVSGGLRLAQFFGVMAPIFSVFGCLVAVLDTWLWKNRRSRRNIWILVLNWLVAAATQFFSYVAFQENEFCQGEGAFGECQRSSGAQMAVFAMLFYFLSLVATIGTMREQVRAKTETMYRPQPASHMRSRQQPHRTTKVWNRQLEAIEEVHNTLATNEQPKDMMIAIADVTMDMSHESIRMDDVEDTENPRSESPSTTDPFSCNLSEIDKEDYHEDRNTAMAEGGDNHVANDIPFQIKPNVFSFYSKSHDADRTNNIKDVGDHHQVDLMADIIVDEMVHSSHETYRKQPTKRQTSSPTTFVVSQDNLIASEMSDLVSENQARITEVQSSNHIQEEDCLSSCDGNTSNEDCPETKACNRTNGETLPASDNDDDGNKMDCDVIELEAMVRAMTEIFGVTLFNSSQDDDRRRGEELKEANSSTDTVTTYLPASDIQHCASRPAGKTLTVLGRVTPCESMNLHEDQQEEKKEEEETVGGSFQSTQIEEPLFVTG